MNDGFGILKWLNIDKPAYALLHTLVLSLS